MSDLITIDKLTKNENRAAWWLNTFNEFGMVDLDSVQDIYNKNCAHQQTFQFLYGLHTWINLHEFPDEEHDLRITTLEQFQIIHRTEILLDELRGNMFAHETKNKPRE